MWFVRAQTPPPVPPNLPIEGVDKFAARWMATLGDGQGAIFSPVGVWPLLAILADVATDEVRSSLEGAIAPPSKDGADSAPPKALTDAALALLSYLDGVEGVAILSGIWAAKHISLRPDFVGSLPAGMVEVLSGNVAEDEAALKAWADKILSGLMSANIKMQEDASAYLASAVIVNTRWWQEFQRIENGRLWRSTRAKEAVRTSPDVTTVCLEGGRREVGDFQKGFPVAGGLGTHNVYLVLGKEGDSPSTVLANGLAAIRGGVAPLTCEEITTPPEPPTPGPGVTITIRKEQDNRPDTPHVQVETPSFRVAATTTLDAELCSLPTRPGENDFPGIAKEPIVVAGVEQQTIGQFTSFGFTAGALSNVHLSGAALAKKNKVVYLDIVFDRPFGFLVVEPHSGLLLFAGWVTENEWTEKDPQMEPHQYRPYGLPIPGDSDYWDSEEEEEKEEEKDAADQQKAVDNSADEKRDDKTQMSNDEDGPVAKPAKHADEA